MRGNFDLSRYYAWISLLIQKSKNRSSLKFIYWVCLIYYVINCVRCGYWMGRKHSLHFFFMLFLLLPLQELSSFSLLHWTIPVTTFSLYIACKNRIVFFWVWKGSYRKKWKQLVMMCFHSGIMHSLRRWATVLAGQVNAKYDKNTIKEAKSLREFSLIIWVYTEC